MNAADTLYAEWTADTYTVTYNGNGSTGGTAPASQQKTYGVGLTLATNSGSLVKTGYTFSGWNTATDGSGTNYTEGGSYAANAGITLYAKWTAAMYTLTLPAQFGGTYGGTSAGAYNYNTAISITANPVGGYVFTSWTATGAAFSACSGTTSPTCSFNMTGDASVTANYAGLAVGVSYQGGKIAYIFQSGDPDYVAGQTHGLIAATVNQADSMWATYAKNTVSVPGGTGTAIGTGSANTVNILNQNGWGYTGIAADSARSYAGGGYSDWYLPSKNELNQLYQIKNQISMPSNLYYWSSSQNDANSAWYQDFQYGSFNIYNKNNHCSVRAIRKF